MHAALAAHPGHEKATEILGLVMRYRRRLASASEPCAQAECTECIAPHVERVMAAIERNEPVVFVLPAFPGKSPNPTKVLGPRPDMAERQSLAFLNKLARRIGEVYAPGARIVLCSDGRVFSDAVGIKESDVTTYQRDLDALLADLGADRLATFNLDDVYGGLSFQDMRAHLMADFGESLDGLKSAVRDGGDTLSLYRGITRFLLEDGTRPDMTMSKTALQKECRHRAYLVIQRSRAWDRLLARYFPNAVRLSIHPQACGSRKIGIHLMETADEWLTPWHGVAVEVQGRYRLMKRQQVEMLGAQLAYRDGRPSHYVVNTSAEAR